MVYRVKDAEIIAESQSGKAWLVKAPDFDCPEWIPKSAIHDDSEIWKLNQEPGELVIHEWCAEQKGWI